jgi:hypothetical protein
MQKIFIIILIFLVFSGVKSNAQLPSLVGGIIENQKSGSIIYKNLKDKYDFIISYHISGGWTPGDTTVFQILALKDKSWKKILLKSSLRNLSGMPKIEVTNFKKQKAKQLMNELTRIGFWSLNNDSLNIKEIKPKIPSENFVNNDTVVIVADRIRRYSIVDGSSYQFEIIQKNVVKVYHCESPESYLSTFPEIKSTIIFIRAKDAFENTIKNQYEFSRTLP